jgi:hypothetical protein
MSNTTPAKDRPHFIVVLRPEPHVADPIKALRGALKTVLRQWGLRCVSADAHIEEGVDADD